MGKIISGRGVRLSFFPPSWRYKEKTALKRARFLYGSKKLLLGVLAHCFAIPVCLEGEKEGGVGAKGKEEHKAEDAR